MRKISSNYVFLPGFPLTKYGVVVLDDDSNVLDVIDTGGIATEECCTEFYGGMIVASFIYSKWEQFKLSASSVGIIEALISIYKDNDKYKGISVISGISSMPELELTTSSIIENI